MSAKYIFVTGGVLSSLGKGVASSSIGSIIQAMGYKIMMKKMDPYLNVDPGTLNPYEHGEAFVTDDGIETDLDLGHYERFTGVKTSRDSNITTGRIYESIIKKERQGDYGGKTVQVVPHVINEIKDFIKKGNEDTDFILCEIGGTVGDIEVLPFLEAARQIKNEFGILNVAHIHLTLIPYIKASEELKTKPTQNSVKDLLGAGIQPDFLLCRTEKHLSEELKDKISLFCNVKPSRIIEAIDTKLIYEIPLLFEKQNISEEITKHFNLGKYIKPDLEKIDIFVKKYAQLDKSKPVKIGIIGKYVTLKDAYKSLNEALINSGIFNSVYVDLEWVDSENVSEKDLSKLNAIVVPGGFGTRGVSGKLLAIKYAREKNIPFLGICFGMQLAVIEFAKNVLKIQDADSTEISYDTKNPVVSLISDLKKIIGEEEVNYLNSNMRLGAYNCYLLSDSKAAKIYNADSITERHRHKYEINILYKDELEKHGLKFSGFSKNMKLTEIVEIPDHRWFIAVQFHPEFNSTPIKPSPLFNSFLCAARDYAANR